MRAKTKRGSTQSTHDRAEADDLKELEECGPGARLILEGTVAGSGNTAAARRWGRARSAAAVQMLDRLCHEYRMRRHARAARSTAWSDRLTTIEVYPPVVPARACRREVVCRLAADVRLTPAQRARLRDALRQVSHAIQGAPVRGQRTEVSLVGRPAVPPLSYPVDVLTWREFVAASDAFDRQAARHPRRARAAS